MRTVALSSVLLCAACNGIPGADSPEALSRAVFEAVRTGNQDEFLARQMQMSDVEELCPMLPASARADVEATLQFARDEAIRSFVACRDLVRFEGARFVRADRSTGGLITTLRWPSCEGTLSFEHMRVKFDVQGTEGSFIVTEVTSTAKRWLFQGGVRLCEGPARS
jgi:hypothetical protein